MQKFDRKLILSDGSEYYGYGFGSSDERITEIVFNTSPVGYQEIISDPSYTYQTVVMAYPLIGNYGIAEDDFETDTPTIGGLVVREYYQEIISDPSYTYQTVVMAYPLIGNYGIAEDDFETDTPTIGGLVVREYNDEPSNFRSKYTLSEIMKRYRIPGIYGIDTRKLVRSIRDFGSRKGLITDVDTTLREGLCKLRSYDIPKDAVTFVSRKEIQRYRIPNGKYQVAAIDCGMKRYVILEAEKD